MVLFCRVCAFRVGYSLITEPTEVSGTSNVFLQDPHNFRYDMGAVHNSQTYRVLR